MVAAVLGKVLRGGRSAASIPQLLPGLATVRRLPQEDLASRPPRLASPPIAAATGMGLMYAGKRFFSARAGSDKNMGLPPRSLSQLEKLCVWTGGSFERFGDLEFQLSRCRKNWKYPASAFGLLCFLLGSFLVEYYRNYKNQKELFDLEKSIQKDEEEFKSLKAEYIELKEMLA